MKIFRSPRTLGVFLSSLMVLSMSAAQAYNVPADGGPLGNGQVPLDGSELIDPMPGVPMTEAQWWRLRYDQAYYEKYRHERDDHWTSPLPARPVEEQRLYKFRPKQLLSPRDQFRRNVERVLNQIKERETRLPMPERRLERPQIRFGHRW